jgi:hypothetical protein
MDGAFSGSGEYFSSSARPIVAQAVTAMAADPGTALRQRFWRGM